jgi:hypothetical protein
LGSTTISWSSKRQTTVFFFFYKIEYIGQTNITKEVIWLQAFLRQLQPDKDPDINIIIIFADN